jgi:hypothetical protein
MTSAVLPEVDTTELREQAAPATETQSQPVRLAPSFVVRGELAGADDYILRAVPAAGGLRRLRARALRIATYAQAIAKEAASRTGLSVESVGTASFQLTGSAQEDTERKLAAYQSELDLWSLAELGGELRVNIASDDRKMNARRQRPLEGALIAGGRWRAAAFSTGWSDPDAIACPGCGATATNSGDGFCMTCAEDDAGAKVSVAPHKVLGALDQIAVSDEHKQMPAHNFEQIARRSQRDAIGYLSFIAPLSLTQELTKANFPDLLILATAQDVLAIGAWDQALRLALDLRGKIEGTFSAGLVIESPHATMRGAARRSREARAAAGEGIAMFGETLDWKTAIEVAGHAFEMAGWLKEGRMSPSALRRIAGLHRMSQRGENHWQLRYLPLLIWESREPDRAIRRRILRLAADPAQWKHTGLTAELAFLAAPTATAAPSSRTAAFDAASTRAENGKGA